jgi:hypothetical protein
MRQFIAVTALAIAATFSCQAFAAGTGGGHVSKIQSVQNGVVIFQTDTQTGAPTCAAYSNQWAIDTSSLSGRAIYALLLTAVNQGKSVTVKGTGGCEAWYDRETAQQLIVNY